MYTGQSDSPLTTEEQQRLDNLLSSARSYNHTSFVLAGLSTALASLDQAGAISLPLGEITLPTLQAAVTLYVLVIVLTIATDGLFRMARPWIGLDPQRPPFAWVALGFSKGGSRLTTLWLLTPVVLCVLSTASILRADTTGFTLSFAGIIAVLLPRNISEYLHLIQNRLDHRGGRATYSMFLLYHYRLLRQVVSAAFFFIPVLAVIPKWRTQMLSIEGILMAVLAALVVIRLVGGISFAYKRIDRFGARYGFPITSDH